MTQRKILVVGLSSAGKSTFISQALLPSLQEQGLEVDPRKELKFAGLLMREFELFNTQSESATDFHLGTSDVAIVHYNLLLQFDWDRERNQLDLEKEPLIRALLDHADDYELHLIYAPEAIFKERFASRTEIEPAFQDIKAAYPKDKIAGYLSRVDQRELILEFARIFADNCAKLAVQLSLEDHFSELSLEEFLTGVPSQSLEARLSPPKE